MVDFVKKNVLCIAVFITGASVLVVEITATRVLSPYFGNTVFSFSSVISVILAALSLGYYLGGRLADKKPEMSWFFGLILVSSLVLAAFHFLSFIFLPIFAYALSISIGPLVSSLFLFFLPAFILGTLSPYAIKLESLRSSDLGVGTVAGKIFFWSTLGSIAGSLLAGFVLIPLIGVNEIIIIVSGALFLLGLVGLLALNVRRNLVKSSAFMFVLLALTSALSFPNNGIALYDKDGTYERIIIFDGKLDGRPTRFLQLDRGSSGAMFLDSGDAADLVYDYTKYYRLYMAFGLDVRRALVIGGGAYSIPKALLKDLPEATVDVAEIEPRLEELAKKYFELKENPRLQTYQLDGRRLLVETKSKYDFIFSDVYYSLFSIPAHFTTQEFFTLAREKLTDDGVFVASMIGNLSSDHPSLIRSEMKTFQSVFPSALFLAVRSATSTETQNIIFVGQKGDQEVNRELLGGNIIDMSTVDLSGDKIMTDNYSPVEYLTGRVLQRGAN
jgi:spermidine synthase